MIIEHLLKCSADTLEQLSNAQLIALFDAEGYFDITRPDRAAKVRAENGTKNIKQIKQSKQDKMMDFLTNVDPLKLKTLKDELGFSLEELI